MRRTTSLPAFGIVAGTAASLLVVAPLVSTAVPATAAPPVQPGTIRRIDQTPSGATPRWGAGGAFLSGDGRYAVYASESADLTPGDRNDRSADAFLFDTQTRTTTLISHNAAGKAANGPSDPTGISTDGRYVVFASAATDLPGAPAANPFGGMSLYRYDVATGAVRLITPSTLDTRETQQVSGVISATGRFVVFTTATSMLPADTDELSDAYLWDGQTGRVRLVSRSQSGAFADGGSTQPDVSRDGHVTFLFERVLPEDAPNPDPNPGRVYRWDPRTGRARVISGALPTGTLSLHGPQISDNARWITFGSTFSTLDGAVLERLYSFDAVAGRRSEIVASGPGFTSGTGGGSMSADGRYVLTGISNGVNVLLPGFRQRTDIYDQVTRQFRTVTVTGRSYGFLLSGDGRHVSIYTYDDSFAAGDSNGRGDDYLFTAS